MLGHNYTCWLKFKGGKGIATSAGVYLALAPWAVLVALVVFIFAVLLTRYVSVGSIAAAIALPVTVWVMTPDNRFLGIVTTALGVLAIYKHKSNIQRLMAGTENRLGQRNRRRRNENHRARRGRVGNGARQNPPRKRQRRDALGQRRRFAATSPAREK